MKDAGVVEIEENLCGQEQQQGHEGFAEEVAVYVAGAYPAAFAGRGHLGL